MSNWRESSENVAYILAFLAVLVLGIWLDFKWFQIKMWLFGGGQ